MAFSLVSRSSKLFTNGHRRKISSTVPNSAPGLATTKTLGSIPDDSPSQLRVLGSKADDYIIKIASENGIDPDLFRHYYITQCTKIGRPPFSNCTRNVEKTSHKSHLSALRVGISGTGFANIDQLTSTVNGYSCDIEAALNGAISDEDPDTDEQVERITKSEVPDDSKHLDLDLDFVERPENSPTRSIHKTEEGIFSKKGAEMATPELAMEYVSQVDLNTESKLVEVCHVVPEKNHFYVRTTDSDTNLALMNLNGLHFPQMIISESKAIRGSPCVVKFGSSWCRGRIKKSALNRGCVTVFLVDRGVIQEYRLPKDNHLIRCLPVVYSMAPLAYHCYLSSALLNQRGFPTEGEIFLAKFHPGIRKGKECNGNKCWEIAQMKPAETGHTDKVESFDVSQEPVKNIPVLPEAKRKEIGDWVNKLDEIMPGHNQMETSELFSGLRGMETSKMTEENWD